MNQKNFLQTPEHLMPRGCGYWFGGYIINNNHEFIRLKQKMVRLDF